MTTKQLISTLWSLLRGKNRPSIEKGGREPSVLDRLLVFGLCVQLIFGVLAFGAVEDWSRFTLELGTVFLFLIWVLRQLGSRVVRFSSNPLYLPAFLFLVVILMQIGLKASAYPYATKYEALQYISYGLVLLIAAESVKTRETRKRFALAMTIFGALYAFFALAQDLTSNGKIYWVRTLHFHGGIFGTYVNRDHYAGLMEMLLPIPLTLSMSHLLTWEKRTLVGFCGALMSATIFLCGSRGGMIAFMLEMVLLAILTFGERRRFPALVAYILLCISTIGFVLLSNHGAGLARIGDLDVGIRPQIVKDSLKMFAERPLLGWGLATFPIVYPRYRTFYTNLFVNEAHNDFAQLLVETGVLGFALMLWFLVQVYRRALPQLQNWQSHWDKALSVSALTACTGILAHSVVDFNLHIPANAAFFYVFCALAASDLQITNWSKGPYPASH